MSDTSTPSKRAENYQEAKTELVLWTKSLLSEVEFAVSEVDRVVTGEAEPGESCPSRYALAEINFRKVHSRLREVQAAIADFQAAFGNELRD